MPSRFTLTLIDTARANLDSLPEVSDEQLRETHDGLEVLAIKDANGQSYLGVTKVPKDPWGREYRYDPPSGNRKEPRVYSYGKDGKAGGAGEDADIEDAGSPEEGK
jgi:general secretion pathway protein G